MLQYFEKVNRTTGYSLPIPYILQDYSTHPIPYTYPFPSNSVLFPPSLLPSLPSYSPPISPLSPYSPPPLIQQPLHLTGFIGTA